MWFILICAFFQLCLAKYETKSIQTRKIQSSLMDPCGSSKTAVLCLTAALVWITLAIIIIGTYLAVNNSIEWTAKRKIQESRQMPGRVNLPYGSHEPRVSLEAAPTPALSQYMTKSSCGHQPNPRISGRRASQGNMPERQPRHTYLVKDEQELDVNPDDDAEDLQLEQASEGSGMEESGKQETHESRGSTSNRAGIGDHSTVEARKKAFRASKSK